MVNCFNLFLNFFVFFVFVVKCSPNFAARIEFPRFFNLDSQLLDWMCQVAACTEWMVSAIDSWEWKWTVDRADLARSTSQFRSPSLENGRPAEIWYQNAGDARYFYLESKVLHSDVSNCWTAICLPSTCHFLLTL
jgi:hypothetical protein